MKICFLCNEYPPGPHGGIGTFVQIMGRALVRAGHAVRVVGAYAQAAPPRADDQGVDVWRQAVPQHRLGWALARGRLYRTVAQWCREGAVDLVEVPDYEGWAAAWPALPCPLVVRLHGSSTYFAAELERPVARLTRWLERRSLRRADFWCSVSRYTAERTRRLLKLRSDATAILYNPVEPADAPPAQERSHHDVVFTGTLAAKKGIVRLIQCWPQVLQSCPQAELHVFGKDGRAADGQSMQEYLLGLLDDRQQASVQFYGHQPRETLFEALQVARLAVFPSYAEAFALAPLEAMTRQCPTIYSRRGSGPELIRDGEDGLLIDPDDVAGLAQTILRLLSDDDLARRLGHAGAQRVRQHFALPQIVAQNEVFYRGCIHAFRPAALGRTSVTAVAATSNAEAATAGERSPIPRGAAPRAVRGPQTRVNDGVVT